MPMDGNGIEIMEDEPLTEEERKKEFGVWADCDVSVNSEENMLTVIMDRPLPGRSKIEWTLDTAQVAAWTFDNLGGDIGAVAKNVKAVKLPPR